jgi:hypothetical protein
MMPSIYLLATDIFLFRYHIPRSFLKSTGNLLVILEEETGNPLGITLDTVYIKN